MSTPGYRVMRAIAEEMLQARERATNLCEDEAQIVGLQRRAKGAREFWNELLRHIETAATIESGDVQNVTM